mmetsp:Transcript_15109/g.17494  ORF Transcript_15109/g.17494 Transcript_15109/m.17494 type:complete len:191 (+) Transcript_15109:414-986(+)
MGIFEAADGSDLPEIHHIEPMIVRQVRMIVHESLHATGEENTHKLMCCCSSGKTMVSALFEKNAYTTSEVAKALVNIHNIESSCPVKSVTIKLKQHVKLDSKHHHYFYVDTVCKQKFPGTPAKENVEKYPIEIELSKSKQNFNQDQDNEEDKEELVEDENEIVEFLQPTTNGKWVNIQYELEISLQMGGT